MTRKISSYFFIINPNAGVRTDVSAISRLIGHSFENYKTEISITKSKGHALHLAKKAKGKNFDCIVTVGGDGTINEILPEIVNSDIVLGIIPKGSGNGFARELGLDLFPYEACSHFPHLKKIKIDAGKINEHFFINAAGFGFDATVSTAFEKFALNGVRGQWPYPFLVFREYFRYKPYPTEITFDSTTLKVKPLLVAFSNSRQYGSGVKISPKARINDGFFDLTIVPAEKFHKLVLGVPSLYMGRIHKLDFIKTYKIKKALIESSHKILYQTDGEPKKPASVLKVEVLESAINLLVPAELEY